jgi:hypothetical protein
MKWAAAVVAWLAMACGDGINIHAPNLTDPTCSHVETYAFTAGDDTCTRLYDAHGSTLFRREGSANCGGTKCLRLEPGETGYALSEIRLTAAPEWTATIDACADVPNCPD